MLRDLVNSCWFAFKWGLLAALLAAIGLGLYYYSRLNDEIRQRVQAKFAKAYPNLSVVVRSAQLIDGQGIEIRGLSISDPRLSGPPAELAYLDEVLFCCQTSLAELLKHEPKITRILVRRPRLQAARLPDGSWSTAQLLPLPKLSENKAEVLIENGQVVVFDPQRNPPITYNFHDLNFSLKPVDNLAAPDQTVYELRGALAADHVQQIEIAGQVNRGTGSVELSGSVGDIDISPELLAALPPDEAARLQPLAPLRGQANLQFHVRRDPTQAQPWQFDVTGDLTSGRFEDARLPQALADLQAKFHADNRGFQIEDLTARNGPTALRWSARVDGYGPNAPMMIEGEATHLLIGRQWEPILPPKLLAEWQKFLPAGEVNVTDAQAVFDGQRWQLQATVKCLGVSLLYHKFRYPVEHANGTLQLGFDPRTQQNRLTMDITAFAGSRPVKIDGEIFNPGPNFTGGVTITGNGLPFDQNLYAATSEVQPKAGEVIQSLHLGGAFNFNLTCQRDDPNSPTMHQHLQVDLDHCSVRYDRFAYPLYNVVGKLEMVDGQWTFRNLEGANHTGHVTCNGSLTRLPEGVSLSLEFRGRDVVLEEELRDALPPRMQPVWNDMKPKGSVDLVEADVNYTSADKQLRVKTTVQPVADTVSIQPAYFPYRLEKVQGAITFTDQRCDFQNLRAIHDRTPISATGFCEHGSDGAFHLHFDNIAADHVRLDTDRDMMIALPTKLRKAVVQLNPTGLVSLHGALDFWGQRPPTLEDGFQQTLPGDCRVVTHWQNLQIDVEQGTLHTGVKVENIHGGGVFNGSYDPNRNEGQRLMCRGELNVDSITWNNFQFTNVAGPLYLDDRQVIVGSDADQPQQGRPPRHLFSRCYGGSAEADAWVALEETPRFAVQVKLNNIDVHRFCVESVPGRQKLQGHIDASARVMGTAAGLHTLNGDGQVQLTNADIGELPVVVALLKVLNLKRPDTNAFTKSDIQFHIDGEHVALKNIEFSGDAISLVGDGEANLDSEINLKLQPIVGRSDLQLPAWKRLMGGASEQIMQVHVTGTLADPRSRREAFPTINQALQNIQTGMQPPGRGLPPPPATDPVSAVQEPALR
ncbi:MAG TPA: AsmA-like C-terminal region-containing protein [Pirellulales bacterium]